MAYTYDDFINAATAAGMLESFSQEDLDTARKSPEFGLSILGLKQDYVNATTEEGRLLANEAANQLRRTYGGYTAGTDGMSYSALPTTQESAEDRLLNYPSFEFSNEEAYQNLINEVANMGSFQYDPATDPAVQHYQKMYAREGQRASQNAMAQAAAMTGGRPSSYAVTAGQQAGNYYAGQMADLMPTLEQNAYDRYLAEQNAKFNQLAALQNVRDSDFEAWLAEYTGLQGSYDSIYGTELDGYGGGSGGGGGSGSGGNGGTEEQAVSASGIPNETLDQVRRSYPNGAITNLLIWKNLVALYGEDALKAEGLRFVQSEESPEPPRGMEEVTLTP